MDSRLIESPLKALQVLKRGIVDLHVGEDFEKKLEKSYRTGIPLKVKAGFDPTSPDLHLGHFVLLKKLRQFQDMGHTVQFVIGDFTAYIGDPTGRSEIRKPISPEKIAENSRTYEKQVFRILLPEQTQVVFNSSWMNQLGVDGLVRLAGLQTVARFLERDDFQKRMAERLPIHLHELLYPLMQGYDSVVLESDVELGGSDQLFNLLVGRDLLRQHQKEPQVVMTLPLLVGLDGEKKMSKSLGNAVALEDTPDEMFGRLMSIPDVLIASYIMLLTDLDPEDISRMHPREAKVRMARSVVSQFHGEEKGLKAVEFFEKVFSRKEIPEDIPVFRMEGEGPFRLSTIMVQSGAAKSESQAKQLIRQGAVDWNGETVRDPFFSVRPENDLLKVGKRFYCRIHSVKIAQ
ncbi:MAG: tyrosine--tRNA ligase [Nitrospirae bacterium]|nr:tyrosine--tRNA ligase [Nitrospirota bacterium]